MPSYSPIVTSHKKVTHLSPCGGATMEHKYANLLRAIAEGKEMEGGTEDGSQWKYIPGDVALLWIVHGRPVRIAPPKPRVARRVWLIEASAGRFLNSVYLEPSREAPCIEFREVIPGQYEALVKEAREKARRCSGVWEDLLLELADAVESL